MRSRITLFVVFALLVSSAAFAQIRKGTVEISPFAGYLFGGQFAQGTTALFNTDVDVDDHATYGVRLGYNVTSKFEVELQASRTETGFVRHEKGKLFESSTSPRLGDLDIDYLLANFTFNFGHRRAVPYITIGGGAARLSPKVAGVQASCGIIIVLLQLYATSPNHRLISRPRRKTNTLKYLTKRLQLT